jgi:hypothetical protein
LVTRKSIPGEDGLSLIEVPFQFRLRNWLGTGHLWRRVVWFTAVLGMNDLLIQIQKASVSEKANSIKR